MPSEFDVTTETSAGVAAVQKAFGTRDYWLARLAKYGGDSMTLDSLSVDADGAVAVTTTQDLRRDMLPGGIARLLPGDTSITRTESWRPAGEEMHGDFTVTARGVPSSGAGTSVLSPVPAGSRLRVHGSLEVRIPLVGARIEKYIADLIVKEVPEMQQFTTEWIAENA